MGIDEVIYRINELSRKAKSPSGLTDDEKIEREKLRNIYRQNVLGHLKGELDNTYIKNEDGSIRKLT